MIKNTALKKTLDIASYMTKKFRSGISKAIATRTEIEPLDEWTLNEIQEINQLVDVLVRAFLNKKSLSWNANDYKTWLESFGPRATGRNPEFERRAIREFPPLVSGEVTFETEPFILCDSDGNVLLWYLPGALKTSRQTAIWEKLSIIEDSFVMNEYASSWRLNSNTYMKPEECDTLSPGTVSLAPAWFQQAHEKSDPLEVSAELRKHQGLQWIEEFSDTAALIGAALSIIHPHQFATGIQAMENLYRNPDLVSKSETLSHVLRFWISPFSGLSIINNRIETPAHRDTGSAYEWMDLLTTVGPYRDGYMKFPGVGVEVPYGSGTMVAVAGKILTHAASSTGERACIAHYMKDKVIDSIVTEERQWANVGSIERM